MSASEFVYLMQLFYSGVGLLSHYVNSGRTNRDIAKAATKLCINLRMQTPRVCIGIINIYVVSGCN